MIQTVIEIIRATRLDLSTEKRAQADLEQAFVKAGIAFEREVHLTQADIIDFLVEGLGIELKVRRDGKKTIYKQLCRYARHPRVDQLLLASNLSMGLPAAIEGKDAYFVKLGEAWL
ncbi:hypothetical protein TA3x_000410 [Tundrisphaera sp. TA3]|uniref:hypothetical protein n=1 Tax=Tundrisphaera sp. TA3 TaxID=3435775 RepID=UPI003EB837D0